MIKLQQALNIMCALKPIDMRKSVDGLSMLVVDNLKLNPTDAVFVFRNKSGDKVKLLYWEKNGFVIHYKRLERGRFKWPSLSNEILELSQDQLEWLLAGLDFCLMQEFNHLNYENYY